MRALKVLMAVMGVLILAGVVGLAVVVSQRLSPPRPAAPAVLDEPPGTHIAQIAASGDRLTVLLQGGGPDRLVVLDLRSGQAVLRAGLSR